MPSFASRAQKADDHPLKAYLYHLIAVKKTNLCVSADVHSTSALLKVAEEVGDHICVLKTHADIVDDFSDRTAKRLQEIAQRKRFLIFEDRKFGDIGNTVQTQYTRGPFRIATWAHLVNAHIFPGPGVVTALAQAAADIAHTLKNSVSTEITIGTPEATDEEGDDVSAAEDARRRDGALAERKGSVVATTTIKQTVHVSRQVSGSDLVQTGQAEASADPIGDAPVERGLLLLAQMSSAGNLMDEAYAERCLDTARAHPGFVVGFVAQEDLNEEASDNFVTMTPGVGLPREGHEAKGDALGQQYRTPDAVVGTDGCDVVIVGRGILGAPDRAKEAARYRAEAWKAYEKRISRKA